MTNRKKTPEKNGGEKLFRKHINSPEYKKYHNQTPDSWDDFEKICNNIEFLHGVPVAIPSEYKKKLKSFIHSLLKQERQRVVEIIKNMDTKTITPIGGISNIEYLSKSNLIQKLNKER